MSVPRNVDPAAGDDLVVRRLLRWLSQGFLEEALDCESGSKPNDKPNSQLFSVMVANAMLLSE